MPMVMEKVAVDKEAQRQFEEQWASVDDIWKLFVWRSSVVGDDSSKCERKPYTEIHACVLRWRLNEIHTRKEIEIKEGGGYLDWLGEMYPNWDMQLLTGRDLQPWNRLTQFRVLICC